jgi:hypothetical protein
MLVGYLDLLAAGGLVEQRMVDGVWYYLPTLSEKQEIESE